MNKFYPIIYFGLLLCSCINNNTKSKEDNNLLVAPSQELISVLQNLNEQTPVQLSLKVTMEPACFDYDSRMFQFNYTEKWPENSNVDTAQAKLDRTRLSTLEEQLANDPDGANRAFLQLLVNEDFGIRVQYIGIPQNDTIKTEVSSSEIRELLQSRQK